MITAKANPTFPVIILVTVCVFWSCGVYMLVESPHEWFPWLWLAGFTTMIPVAIRMIRMCKRELVITEDQLIVRGEVLDRRQLRDVDIVRVRPHDMGALHPVRLLRFRYLDGDVPGRMLKFQRALGRLNLKKETVDGRPTFGDGMFVMVLNDTDLSDDELNAILNQASES